MDAKVAVPDNAGLAERTTDPVPVEDVVPVPPRATASVPDPALPMLRLVTPEPSPVCVPENVPPVIVPVNVGLAERTTDPVPVEDVTPVPPRATARVPDPALPMFSDVIPDPAPVRVVALTVAAFMVPVGTSRAVAGFVVPIPTLPAAFTKSAVAPVCVRKVATFPVPSCWTLKALPDAVLPITKTLLELKITGTLGTP
jgi:hypothetical protein